MPLRLPWLPVALLGLGSPEHLGAFWSVDRFCPHPWIQSHAKEWTNRPRDCWQILYPHPMPLPRGSLEPLSKHLHRMMPLASSSQAKAYMYMYMYMYIYTLVPGSLESISACERRGYEFHVWRASMLTEALLTLHLFLSQPSRRDTTGINTFVTPSAYRPEDACVVLQDRRKVIARLGDQIVVATRRSGSPTDWSHVDDPQVLQRYGYLHHDRTRGCEGGFCSVAAA
ncbi:hypothetical protein LY76DRAFT_333080 [Colletotrichum caudatum]|nr:hypothetical protein LY76DRAFT_333080 [Colletotrichum caudatum]